MSSSPPQAVFKRYEIKFLMDRFCFERLRPVLEAHTRPDRFAFSRPCSVYYDTPDRRLIRRSLNRPVYKEKLRLRSYGPASPDDAVFVELKKKYRGCVYKRRISMPESAAEAFLAGRPGAPEASGGEESQIRREIAYFLAQYPGLEPAVYISCERTSLVGTEDARLRITLDENIAWRDTGVSLTAEPGGRPLLDADTLLMEVKAPAAISLWLARALTKERIFKTSFSKYGNAYLSSRAAGTCGAGRGPAWADRAAFRTGGRLHA